MGMYLVSRHDDLQTILRDPITFSQELGYYKQMATRHLDEMKEILEREGGGFFPDVVNLDPPRHRRVRTVRMQAFIAKRMQALAPKFEAPVDPTIDALRHTGQADALTNRPT